MILAIDIGTSAVKSGIFSEEGVLLGTAAAPVAMISSDDPLAREIDPLSWIGALASTLPRLLGPSRPELVVVSGNGPTLVPVGPGGEALGGAITWMDGRARVEAAEASKAAGLRVDPSFNLPKVLWLARRRPEIYERAAWFLSCPEYLVMALTGAPTSIVPEGYEGLYGEATALEALKLDRDKFPPASRPGLVAGISTAAGEAAVGLPRGATVVAVGPDYLASIVGTASVLPGRACDRAGTSEGINLCAARPIVERRLICVPHLARPFSNISGTVSASGAAVDWWMRASGLAEAGYERFLELAGGAEAGASRPLFLPHLSGERAPLWDPDARGAFLGLELGHGPAELARAVLESTAFAMRDIIEVMEAAGARVAELRVTGKPGRSSVWNQVKADVTGRPILLPVCAEPELLGDVCMALAATGRYAYPAEAAGDLVTMGGALEPKGSTRSMYDDMFGAYRRAYEALSPVLAGLRAAGAGGER